MPDNYGVINTGDGVVVVTDSAVGFQSRVVHRTAPADPRSPGRSGKADVGVLTVLGVELRAVVDALAGSLDYREHEAPGALRFHRATTCGVRVVLLQSLHLGQRSAMVAFAQMREHWAPPVVALVGVAGAVHHSVELGDVVVSDEVVYYDMRKETPDGALRRGQSLSAPPMIGRKLNAFFARHDDPLQVADRAGRVFQVRRGAIGSGEAVVSDPASDIRTYLGQFKHTLLAVETEAGGIAQAVYEGLGQGTSTGWLTVRGISDRADGRDYAHHDIASRHAADVLVRLLPFLTVEGAPG